MNILMDRWLKNRKKLKWENTSSSDNDPAIKEEDTCSSEGKILPPIRPPKRKTKKRRYHDSYIAFGFVSSCQDDGLVKPLCVLCNETLANESMRPAKLRRHLEAKHKEYSSKPVEYFISIKDGFLERREKLPQQPKCKPTSAGRENENAVLASYDVALMIANSGIPHTIAEELILPAAKAIARRMHGPEAADNYNMISLSNTTVKRRIENMAENVKKQLLSRVLGSQYYSLLLDEGTDVCDKAYLLLFIRYEYQDKINEDFLFCQSLPADASSDDIFITLNDFILANQIGWLKCVGVCTDGSLIRSNRYQEVLVKIQSIGPHIKLTHCCVRRESLAVRQMPAKLKTTLDEAVQVINLIKTCATNSHVINILCKEMGSSHEQLLMHSQVHWLSQGKVLTRMFDMRDEIRLILRDKAFHGSEWFCNFSWLAKVAYLSDMFAYLNDMNLSLQGKILTIFQVQEKVEAFISKLELWSKHFQCGMFDAFPTLSEFLSHMNTSEEIMSTFIEHLQCLKNSLRDYFPVLNPNIMWIRDPFLVDANGIQDLSAEERRSLVNLSCDVLMKSHYSQSSLWDFWSHAKTDHPELASIAFRHLMPFPTTCICEQAFSQLIYIKSKYRTRMNVEPDLRLKLSTIEPEIETIVAVQQHQPSH